MFHKKGNIHMLQRKVLFSFNLKKSMKYQCYVHVPHLLSLRSFLEDSDLAGDGSSQFLFDGVISSSSSHALRDGVLRSKRKCFAVNIGCYINCFFTASSSDILLSTFPSTVGDKIMKCQCHIKLIMAPH